MKNVALLLCFYLFLYSNAQIKDFKKINFTKADNIASLCEGENLTNLPLLVHQLTYKLSTDVEKFRAIYKWVCNNIKYDINSFTTINKKRKKLNKNDFIVWNNEYKKKVYKRLLKRKKTMCTGYAYLLKELAFIAGINCKIIDGYGRTSVSNIDDLETLNHSWNAVFLNNKWYLCDPTWSTGFINYNSSFIKSYNDGYFLTDPTYFNQNHFPLDKKWLLSSSQTKKTFICTPIIYSETFKHGIFPSNSSSMYVEVAKKESLNFEYIITNDKNIHNYSLIYFLNNTENKLKIYNHKKENNVLKFNTILKRRGTHDIHFKIKNDIVASYTIKVK